MQETVPSGWETAGRSRKAAARPTKPVSHNRAS
jgi:hypothetical protein